MCEGLNIEADCSRRQEKGLCADEIRMHSCTKRGCVPKKLCANELCANGLCANEAVCRKSDSAMYKKKHRDSVDAACGSRVGPFSKLQLEANGNGSTEQADGVGRRADGRSRRMGRPTEQADGAGRRSRPTE